MRYRDIPKDARDEVLFEYLKEKVRIKIKKDQMIEWLNQEATYIRKNLPEHKWGSYIMEGLMAESIRPSVREGLKVDKFLDLDRFVNEVPEMSGETSYTLKESDIISRLIERLLLDFMTLPENH